MPREAAPSRCAARGETLRIRRDLAAPARESADSVVPIPAGGQPKRHYPGTNQ